MRKPKPTVTAETPSGSMNAASSSRTTRRPVGLAARHDTTTLTHTPSTSASNAASIAMRQLCESALTTPRSPNPR